MRKMTAFLMASAMSAIALSACGKPRPAHTASSSTSNSNWADDTDFAALQLANGNARPATQGAKPQAAPAPSKLNCPANINLPKGQPDVRGIAAGANLDQVILYIQCQDRSVPYHVLPTRQMFKLGWPDARQFVHVTDEVMAPANDSWVQRKTTPKDDVATNPSKNHNDFFLLTTGAKGAEVVYGVWYTQSFADGKNPTFADSLAALVAKYGQPSYSTSLDYTSRTLAWFHNAQGQQVRDSMSGGPDCAFSPEFQQVTLNPACGLTIIAVVRQKPGNATLAQSVSYGFLNQVDMYNALMSYQHQHGGTDEERRQAEVKAAGQNKPSL